MNVAFFKAIGQILAFAIMLALGIFVGGYRERRHFQELDERERQFQDLPATTGLVLPGRTHLSDPVLVHGEVVISVDYFKQIAAAFRAIVGGRFKAYESLLVRARREAVLRMKEMARAEGVDAIVNVRLETSRLANGRGGKGTAGVEILAFGTGVRAR